jgi:ATP synthase protein I
MAEDETEQDPTSPQDSRLTSLDERLKRAERVEGERKPAAESKTVVRSAGTLLAQNLVGMPLGGFVVGFLFDQLFGTVPWIALALMFIGFAGGVLQLMKSTKQGGDRDAGK